jgi:hypothetical protein
VVVVVPVIIMARFSSFVLGAGSGVVNSVSFTGCILGWIVLCFFFFVAGTSAGGTNKDAANGIDVNAGGNSSIAGEFQGSAVFGSTTLISTSSLPDVFIARYDASGNVVWAKKAGGGSNDHGRNVTVDGSGNSYVTGEFEGSAGFDNATLTSNGGVDIFVANYDASGNVLWVRRAGSSVEDRASGISLDGMGNIFISGYFSGTASFDNNNITSSGSSDAYVTKLSDGVATGLYVNPRLEILTYPNPFNRFINVGLSKAGCATITLSDLLGRQVHCQEINVEVPGTSTIFMSDLDLPSGVYMLQVKQGDAMQRLRIVRE